MKFNERSLDCLRGNFAEMVLSTPVILGLYQVASLVDDEVYCPTHCGNLHTWIDVMSDEWLSEQWDEWSEFSGDEKLDMEGICVMVKMDIVRHLKDIIDEEVLIK